jgi:hypothetical protein
MKPKLPFFLDNYWLCRSASAVFIIEVSIVSFCTMHMTSVEKGNLLVFDVSKPPFLIPKIKRNAYL